MELLTYHRATQRRELRCPECKKRAGEADRKCYWCGELYTDEHGMVTGQTAALDALRLAALNRDLTDEPREEIVAKANEQLREAKVHRLEEGLKPGPELDALKRKLGMNVLGDRDADS